MKKVLLALCLAGLIPTTAYAELFGWWTKDTSLAGMDRWTLMVTPTNGDIMYGFDIAVWDTAAGAGYQDHGSFQNNGNAFGGSTYATPDQFTRFLLRPSHGTTTDLLSVVGCVDSSDIAGAFAVTGSGAYASGWSNTLALLEIVVPSGTYGPITYGLPAGLSVGRSDEGSVYPGALPAGVVQNSGKRVIWFYQPEPGTLTLLGSGLFGLLAYAWRKRK